MDLDITELQQYLSSFIRIQIRERLTWGIEAEHPVGMVPAADTQETINSLTGITLRQFSSSGYDQ
jgi:hypothetical protein